MTRKTQSIVIAMMVLLLFVASCSAGTVTIPTGTVSMPAAATDLPAVQATVEMAAECAGIDTQAMITAGQTLYTDNCASCHGEQGEGVGDFPPLAENQVVTAADIQQLAQGYFEVSAHPKELAPQDIAALFTYTRVSFGNTAEVVCPVDITIPPAQ